ncbi:MAG: heme-binding protein [Methylococcaceae bacterium]|jgi:uncharacterized protein GlcG (DUF336 family)
MKISKKVVAFTIIAASLSCPSIANTEAKPVENQLTLDLAMEAATEAIKFCSAQGWNVSASVVDSAGNIKVQAKGDNSTIHTKDTSFRKAYTQVSMGPIFGFDALSVWVDKLKGNPNAVGLASIPNIIVLPGAVAIKIHDQTVAAIGVGGAPGGDKDEACAAKGLEKIKDRLAQR